MTTREHPGRRRAGETANVTATRRRGRPVGGQPVVDRERVLDAAERAIARDGSGVSIETIAAEAGVTKPIIYARVGGRAALSDALAGRLARRISERAGREIEGMALDRAALERLFAGSLSAIGEHRELFLFVTRGSADDAPQRTLYLAAQSVAPLSELLRTWRGGARRDDAVPTTWAYGIIGMLNLVAQWWLEEEPADVDELAGQLARLVWSGVGDGA